MEKEIKLVKLMDHKEAYEKFEKDLLKLLPADQPKFIELLQAKDVISRETKKKMDVPNRTRVLCAAAILEEIEKSTESSDPEKFDKLLSVMEEYNPVLEELAKQIKNNLDPVGTPFVLETMREYFGRNTFSLSKLSYKEMKWQFLSREILIFDDIRRNESSYGNDHLMSEVLNTIQRSLGYKVTRYFKQFLEIMEESDNPLWQRTAKRLAIMKCFEGQNQINSSVKLLKRQVVFNQLSSYEDTKVNLCLVDPKADGHIIKLFRDKKISKQKVDFLGLTALNYFNVHFETNFPSWCTLHIIGELSPSSSILTVYGLCGVNKKSTDFSLLSPTEPTEHGCQFEYYQHIPPEIIKKASNSQLPEAPAAASVDSHSSLANINLFISYAWEGATNDFVEKLKHDLESAGLQIFLDKHEILPGDNIQHEVAKGMDKANGIIVVYSKRYPDSEWCNKELQMAERQKKPIFPVRRITGPYQRNVDLALGSILYVNFSLDDQYEASLEFLIKGIKKNCQKQRN